MAAAVTVGGMVTSVRRRTNLERNFNFIPDVEIVEYIDEFGAELYDLLCEVGGQEWFRKTWEIVTRAASGSDPGDTYPLPPDFLKLTSAEIVYAANVVQPIAPYMETERAAFTRLTGWNIGSPAWYRMLGKDKIRFIPQPGGAYTVNLNGYPIYDRFASKVTYTDSTNRTLLNGQASFDGINGWEAYVIWKVVATCQGKQKVDPSLALSRAAEMADRIRTMAQNRDMTNNERVQDVVGFCDEGWYW